MPSWKRTVPRVKRSVLRSRIGKRTRNYWVRDETHAALLRVSARLDAYGRQCGWGAQHLDDVLWRAARMLDRWVCDRMRARGMDPMECLRELESEATVAPPPRLDGVVRDD